VSAQLNRLPASALLNNFRRNFLSSVGAKMRKGTTAVLFTIVCATQSHAQTTQQTFNSIVPSGVYVQSNFECDALKQNPLKTLKSERFEYVGVKGMEISRHSTGECKVKNFSHTQGDVNGNFECFDEGDVSVIKFKFSIKDNQINFGEFDNNGNTWRFLCEFNRKNLPRAFQFQNAPGTKEPALLGGASTNPATTTSTPQSAAQSNMNDRNTDSDSQHLKTQIEILKRVNKKKELSCKATVIKETLPWNMAEDAKGREVFAPLSDKYFNMQPEDIYTLKPGGRDINFFSDQMDSTPSPTIDGGSKIFLLEIRNYFYPLENLSIIEKSCKPYKRRT